MSEVLALPRPTTKRDLLTYDDYVTFPDQDGIRKEIIEGELYMTPAPATKHQLIVLRLAKILDDYVLQYDLGTILISPFDVIFSNLNVIQPDILFISKENSKILTDLNAKGAPDLIVEILSPATMDNDRIYKKLVYEKSGVKEYWIVDSRNNVVEVWILKDKRYRLYVQAGEEQRLKSQLFRELEIDLDSVFM
ncbi:Uma2 family endonuclease [candidate division KSB1 bacterium]|nr:Uma2 family endonuclease [candidate division KSB1 bacterium]